MVVENHIRQMRLGREVTQEELAAAVKVSRQTIVAIEKGNYTPSLLLAMNLAEYFSVPVEKLFTVHNP
jgi:putative transcriptional regulator